MVIMEFRRDKGNDLRLRRLGTSLEGYETVAHVEVTEEQALLLEKNVALRMNMLTLFLWAWSGAKSTMPTLGNDVISDLAGAVIAAAEQMPK